MRRRDFLVLGSTAVAWPLAVRAQQAERMRRVGVLMAFDENNSQAQARITAFKQGLRQLGWTDGRNVQIEYRWSGAVADTTRKYAGELAAIAPDVILVAGSAAATPMLQATRKVPIVFVLVPDPVGAGYVGSLARPGRNATGFASWEYGLAAKWLELLKQIAPSVTRVAVIRDPAITAGIGQWGAIQAMAPSINLEAVPINVRDAGELESDIAAVARSPNSGLILTGSGWAVVHRDLIIKLAARHKLPTLYFTKYFVAAGGLVSYGPDLIDQFRRAATYVDRILKGEKPANLPVQAPTKYELAINLKTAKALGLTIPPALLTRADETIE